MSSIILNSFSLEFLVIVVSVIIIYTLLFGIFSIYLSLNMFYFIYSYLWYCKSKLFFHFLELHFYTWYWQFLSSFSYFFIFNFLLFLFPYFSCFYIFFVIHIFSAKESSLFQKCGSSRSKVPILPDSTTVHYPPYTTVCCIVVAIYSLHVEVHPSF